MDILTAFLVGALLFMAGVYSSAPRHLTIALYVAAMMTVGISFLDEPGKIRAENARIAKIETEKIAMEKAEEEQRRQNIRIRVARERKERQQKLMAENKRKRELEKHNRERKRKAAEINSRLPGSFQRFQVRIAARTKALLFAKRECLVDDVSSRRNFRREISIPQGRIYYTNTNPYSNGYVEYLFFDDLDGGCRTSIRRLADSGYLNGTPFNQQRYWTGAVRVLRPGQAPPLVNSHRRSRRGNNHDIEDIVKEGIGNLFKRGLENILKH